MLKVNVAKFAKENVRLISSAVANFDPSTRLANHLVGHNHSKWHRWSVGTIIIVLGVGVAEIPLTGPAHFIANAVGYLIHALGGLAFLSPIDKKADQNE